MSEVGLVHYMVSEVGSAYYMVSGVGLAYYMVSEVGLVHYMVSEVGLVQFSNKIQKESEVNDESRENLLHCLSFMYL